MPRIAIAVLLALCFSGCSSTPTDVRPAGKHACESFFIYDLCVADRDLDGLVDYMYFDDTREIFMYESSMINAVSQDFPLHRCAIPMSASTRDLSSQLLYGEERGLSARLALKGKLIRNYRAAQPAVDACNKANKQSPDVDNFDDPFVLEDDWDEGAL